MGFVGLREVFPESLAVYGDGIIEPAFIRQDSAEIRVSLGKIVLEPNGRTELNESLVLLASVFQGGAEVVASPGVIFLEADGFTVLRDGLVQAPLV
jgi:hypothetical protein